MPEIETTLTLRIKMRANVLANVGSILFTDNENVKHPLLQFDNAIEVINLLFDEIENSPLKNFYHNLGGYNMEEILRTKNKRANDRQQISRTKVRIGIPIAMPFTTPFPNSN